MINYYIGNNQQYDVVMEFVKNEKWGEIGEPMYIVNKIIVNKPSMYEFYEKNYKNAEVIKGFVNG